MTDLNQTNTRFVPWVLLMLAAVVYSNTLHVPFLLDDIVFIVESESIRSLSLAFWQAGWSDQNWIDLRPVTDLSFRLNYQISGLDVWSYHVVNIGIHAANAILLWSIIKLVLGFRLKSPWPQWIALGAAAIWGVHPINVNAVTYISQRFESLAALFALAAIRLFLAARVEGRANAQWWCVACVLASFGSKESTLALPLVLLALDQRVLSPLPGDRLHRQTFYLLLFFTWVAAAMLFLASQRTQWTEGEGGLLFDVGNLRMQSVVIFYYLAKLIWPSGLVFDQGLWTAPLTLHWVAATLTLAAAFIWSLVATWRGSLAGFGILCAFLFLAPSSSFIVVPTYDAADYRAYLSAAFLVAVIVAAFGAWVSRQIPKMQPTSFLAVVSPIVLLLAVTTWNRNAVYRSSGDVWADNLTKRPTHEGSYLGFAEALMKSGDLAGAEIALSDARRRFPDHARLLNLSGLVALEDGRVLDAGAFWSRANQLAPDNHVILNNLAILAAQKGEWSEAQRFFLQVAELRPTDLIALGNAAQVCLQLGDMDEADNFVRRGLDVYPNDEILMRLRRKIDELMLMHP